MVDHNVTIEVEVRRMYTFRAEADLEATHLQNNPGGLATMSPRMGDYKVSLVEMLGCEVKDASGNVDRPTLLIKAKVTGTAENIQGWLEEMDNRHTIHTEVTDSERLREYHKARKAKDVPAQDKAQ